MGGGEGGRHGGCGVGWREVVWIVGGGGELS